ncbi:hypothetical protein NQ317_003601 [Molorchus minor]|uniref:Uncharacterized protein n=1 Tax=Molorchus minor TaxID=1323400 RepID=A0ABQ9JB53_9CUCU|nr:hypothetical protein NQ317_003601 [Molorchus minor]
MTKIIKRRKKEQEICLLIIGSQHYLKNPTLKWIKMLKNTDYSTQFYQDWMPNLSQLKDTQKRVVLMKNFDDNEDESSDGEHTWTQEVKKQHRIIQREHRRKELQESLEELAKEREENQKQPKLFELRQGEEYKGIHNLKRKLNK